MTEPIIKTRRGEYGRLNVTLPLELKTAMLLWAKRSGMKKSEFLRMALTTGFILLSSGIPVHEREREDDPVRGAQMRAPAREEDARAAPSAEGLDY